MAPCALAHVTRGDLVESTHYGDIAICDAGAAMLWQVGEPAVRCYFRSSAKPIQALTVVLSGAAQRFEFSSQELAICCASHCGSAAHIETVRGILAKLGLAESALDCGAQEPSDAEERARLAGEHAEPLAVHNNCSGKHAGMLAAAVAMGAPVDDYLNIEHPVQRSILANTSLLTGLDEGVFVIGVDGCGAPTIGVPLAAIATSFARLTSSTELPLEVAEACAQVCEAMAAAPEMVSGEGSFNTELLAEAGGALTAKGGAEGLFACGLLGQGLGIAFSISDGSSRSHRVILMRILDLLATEGVLVPALPEDWRQEPVTNCHQRDVGQMMAADFDLS